jgi:hypothetical protein
MLNLPEFDVEICSDAQEGLDPSCFPAPAVSDKTFPVFDKSLSYDQLAEELTHFFVSDLNSKPISKNTLKNNWLNVEGRISRIYKNLQTPPLKTESGRVTPFGIQAVFEFTQLVHLGLKPYDDYVLEIQSQYELQVSPSTAEDGDKVASTPAITRVDTITPDYLQPSAPPVPPTSRLNLPTIQPVTSAIVPATTSLLTDFQKPETLAKSSKEVIEENSQDLEEIRKLLTQVNAFVDSKINQLDSETETTQRQVQELKDLAFQLEVRQETLRRAEIRNAAARQESEVVKAAATSKVISLSDFFAQRSGSQSGS